MAEKRKDNKGRVLKENEAQRKDGSYQYRWRDRVGKRHYVYAKTLDILRDKEEKILRDKSDGIKVEEKRITVNDMFDLWVQIKRGVKDNTFQNYQYMYNQFVYDNFGKLRVTTLKRSDVRRFYNLLVEQRHVKVRTIENIHTVLFQVLELCVEEDYLRVNPAHNAMKELKQTHNFETERRRALTMKEHELFINFLNTSEACERWRNIFTVMINTGLRVGELTGLRWNDIDFENNTISVNHTLVYYNHKTNGCYFNINTPKTKAGFRTIPMLEVVKEAFLNEKKYQEESGVPQNITIDGYTNFIFINRYGNVQNQGMLNKALRYIVRECNEMVLDNAKDCENVVLLPRFSCHSLRHTFTTRLCEAGVNIKVIQDTLGHADIKTTMNIYADATKELKDSEFARFDDYLKAQNSIVAQYTHSTPDLHPKEENI